jgi:hypothetical protein
MGFREQQQQLFGNTGLPLDCVYLILQYLSLTERVRFERLSSVIASVLVQIWSQQRSLAILDRYGVIPERNQCRVEYHRFQKECIFSAVHVDQVKYVLARCPQLRSLHWDYPSFVGLDRFLSKQCPLIEHLSFSDMREVADFTSYPTTFIKGNECKVTCIHVTDRFRPLNKWLNKQLQELIVRCPRLHTYRNDNIFCYVGPHLPASDVHMGTITKGFKVTISSCSNLLKCLSLRNIILEDDVITICKKFPLLESLEIQCKPSVLPFVSQHLKKLKHLKWCPDSNVRYQPGNISGFLQSTSSRLLTLKLQGFQLKSDEFNDIGLHCPNLRSLTISIDGTNFDGDHFVSQISKLPHLREVKLFYLFLSEQALNTLLQNCKHIRVIVADTEEVNANVIEALVNFAQKCPTRKVYVNLTWLAIEKFKFTTEHYDNLTISYDEHPFSVFPFAI